MFTYINFHNSKKGIKTLITFFFYYCMERGMEKNSIELFKSVYNSCLNDNKALNINLFKTTVDNCKLLNTLFRVSEDDSSPLVTSAKKIVKQYMDRVISLISPKSKEQLKPCRLDLLMYTVSESNYDIFLKYHDQWLNILFKHMNNV